MTMDDRDKARFWAKTKPGPTVREELGPCIDWTASTNDGYGAFNLGGRAGGMKKAHRIAWLIETGEEAPPRLDHRCHRRICVNVLHLRSVTAKQNQENRAGPNRRKGKMSRYNGVAWDKNRGRWIVNITHNSRTHFGGRFDDEDEAGRAAADLRNKLFTHNDQDHQEH